MPDLDAQLEGTDPLFAARLKALIAASGGRVSIVSGYRSRERQEQLWQQALAKYGSPEAARKWVADPNRGKGSNHMHGLAVDLGFADDSAREWVHANASRFGLHFPMSWEPWHIEPVRTAVDVNLDAYTEPPIGVPPAADQTDPVVQITRLLGMLDQDLTGALSPEDPLADIGGEAAVGAVGPAGGLVPPQTGGAAMRDFGFLDEPDRMAAELEEQLD